MPARYSFQYESTAASSLSNSIILAVATPSSSATGSPHTYAHGVLCEFGISFRGNISVDNPVKVDLCQISATTTTPASNVSSQKWARDTAAPICLVTTGAWTSPTVNPISSWYVHPQGGNLVIQYPLGREPLIVDGTASTGIAWRLTTSSSNFTTGTPFVLYGIWEE